MHTTRWNWPNPSPQLIWTKHECPRCTSVEFKPAELRSFYGLLARLACPRWINLQNRFTSVTRRPNSLSASSRRDPFAA